MIKEKYRIVRQLGSGGEGTVYLVQHRLTEQLRAAKVLSHTSGSRRFQELNAMKRLEHPGLPQIYDVLEENDQIWLIMEYVKGRCIHEIPPEECSQTQFFSIASQLAAILVYLHSRPMPVFHLDIKPSNLLLKEDGTLVLIDFGAAMRKTVSQDQNVRRQHEIFGTPGFAAPEQFTGKGIDGRSDLYGAGAVLYYYLFRRAPETGAAEWKIQKPPYLLHRKISSRAIFAILKRCLQTEAADRFPDARSFQKAVNAAKRRYERWKNAASLSAALLFLGGATFLAVYQWKGSQLEQQGADVQQQEEKRRQTYQGLLEQAGKLGFGQAALCFQEASSMADGDLQWICQLLDRITEDCIFTVEEETVLKQLLFQVEEGGSTTALELLSETPEFGELGYRIGLAYWHYYEAAGGKSAAAEWFALAVKTGKKSDDAEQESWYQQTLIYAKIGSYYEKLGKKDENGIQLGSIVTYWEDLQALWTMESRKDQSLAIQKQLAEELLSCLIFHAAELKAGGISRENQERIRKEIDAFQSQYPSVELTDSCKSAEAAIKRAYQKEMGETDEEN